MQVEDPGQFIPSTWRSDLTPTRPAIKSPENGTSPARKTLSVSFTNLRSLSFRLTNLNNYLFNENVCSRKRVYEYPSEEEEVAPSPTRRQWQAPADPATSAYANFADWEFAAADENEDDRAEDDSVDGSPPK